MAAVIELEPYRRHRAIVYRLLPTWTWRRSRLGALCFHPSLLPRHRGRDAVYWTIKHADTTTGATWFWPDAGIDTGPIAGQEAVAVPPGIRPRDLYELHIVPAGLRLLRALLPRLDAGERPATPQDETRATYEPPREKAKVPDGAAVEVHA